MKRGDSSVLLHTFGERTQMRRTCSSATLGTFDGSQPIGDDENEDVILTDTENEDPDGSIAAFSELADTAVDSAGAHECEPATPCEMQTRINESAHEGIHMTHVTHVTM